MEDDAGVVLGEVKQGGADAEGGHFDYGGEAGVKAGEFNGGVGGGFGLAEYPDDGFGDDAENALAADEKAVQVGAGGGFRNGAGVDDAAVGEDGFQGHHLVAHRAVGGGAVADAVGGDGAAESGDGDAVGVVAGHQAGGRQGVVEVLQDLPGFGFGG